MKKILLSACIFFFISSQAQDLINSRTGSYFNFIYKITNEEARTLYQNDDHPLNARFFHTLVEFYPNDSLYRKQLPIGHYLFIYSSGSTLFGELESVNNLEMVILNNHRDLILMFSDKKGRDIGQLKPQIENKNIPFNKKLSAYRIPTSNRKGWISVNFESHTSYFNISRKYNNTLPVRVKRRVLGTFPINHIFSPVFYITRTVKGLFSYPHISPPGIYHRIKKVFQPKYFDGYSVTNKPKYRPGDTVKIKAFVVKKKNGRTVNKPVSLFLRGNYINRKIGKIKPYRSGAYAYEFILNDSLKLQLDRNYSLVFEDRSGNDYPTAHFDFEQYELKQNFFSLRKGSEPDHKPAILFLKGSDANDLPLYDIRVELLVISKDVREFEGPSVFIRDTLWRHELKLEPLGETKVSVPDSIYVKAAYDYEVAAVFINADNERHVETLQLKYDYRPPLVEVDMEDDSVQFKSTSAESLELHVLHLGEAIRKESITLPYKEKVDGFVNAYTLIHNNVIIKRVDLSSERDKVEVVAQRTKDSLRIAIQNPRQLHIRYQLFKNNQIIECGNATSLVVKRKTRSHDRYYLSIQYLWAGEARDQNYDFPFARKSLKIELEHPLSAFPGQVVDVTVRVKDSFEKPVEDADLTAYAVTKKFRNTHTGSVPNFEHFKSRKIFNEFNSKDEDVSLSALLDYNFWKKSLGLDSIEYYHFLYPEKGQYVNYSKAEDSITQVAPFVVSNGVIKPVYFIYLDNDLAYYYGNESLEPYSFRARAGKCTIKIRLRDRLLTIKDFELKKGLKAIISIDLFHPPTNVEVSESKSEFSAAEISRLWPHFLSVTRNTDQSEAYFQQGDNFHVLPPVKWGTDSKLVGPFFAGPIRYHSNFDLSFQYRSGRIYTFSATVVDRETVNLRNHFQGKLNYYGFNKSLKDQVQTASRIRDFYKKEAAQKNYRVRKYPETNPVSKYVGSLSITENKNANRTKRFATFIINLDAPDEYYIFPGNRTFFSSLLPGSYQLIVMYDDESYLKPKPIYVKVFGRRFYDLNDAELLPPDTFSKEIMNKIKSWSEESVYVEPARQYDMQDIRELYYREATNYSTLGEGRWVQGTVTDETGSLIPGVNVILKGTTNGTVTNAEGEYRIFVPVNGILVFSFVGYSSEEVNTHSHEEENIQMNADVAQLNEVVVIGYGTVTHKYLTGSVTSLQGRAAGVSLLDGGTPGVTDSVSIKIRGATSLGGNGNVLVVIDGVIKSLDDIDQSKITSIEILDVSKATAIYGVRGSNGVVLISTKPGVTRAQLMQTKLPDVTPFADPGESAPGSSLRKNFRDYAFWQPKLRTNKHGEVKFSATLPDDITGWNIHVLGMASSKRSGSASSNLQSFKPLAAQLTLPNFLVEGDVAWAVGKITNYGSDSISIRRKIFLNEKINRDNVLKIKNSLIDSIKLVALEDDSVTVKYAIEYGKYEDGELRKVPIFPIGTKETIGFFVALPRDTAFALSFDPFAGPITIFAQADMLDVLLDEIATLRLYPYECNEQLASKLKALLAEKLITEYRKEKFTRSKLIERIIKKLLVNQYTDGSWSWWGMRGGSQWITIHVGEALRWASQQGFKVKFDQQGLNNYLLENTRLSDEPMQQLKSWVFLSESGEKIAVKPILDSLQRKNKLKTTQLKLMGQRLLQLQHEPVDWKWIDEQRQQTLKGNFYWGEHKYSEWRNDVDITLLVYKLIEARDSKDAQLLGITNYFLENRKTNSWTNTFESSRIIETILPGFLHENKHEIKPTLTLNGMEEIKTFPFKRTTSDMKELSIAKVGSSPLYITAYQEKWNQKPQRVESNFVINTAWQDEAKKLKSGKPVKLVVTLEVKKDAEYVMINVPIPAGCSYNSRNQNWSNGEVHREYDIHETRIYCERMRAGQYTYTIDLIPRYKGEYNLNPAKAEWMYFPVIYGREGMKTVTIN